MEIWTESLPIKSLENILGFKLGIHNGSLPGSSNHSSSFIPLPAQPNPVLSLLASLAQPYANPQPLATHHLPLDLALDSILLPELAHYSFSLSVLHPAQDNP